MGYFRAPKRHRRRLGSRAYLCTIVPDSCLRQLFRSVRYAEIAQGTNAAQSRHLCTMNRMVRDSYRRFRNMPELVSPHLDSVCVGIQILPQPKSTTHSTTDGPLT